MRKLYLLLLFIVISATLLATYATFFSNKSPYVIDSPDGKGTSRRPILNKDIYEYSKRTVDGHEFVLVSIGGDSQMRLLELIGDKYYALDSEYNWADAYIVMGTQDFWFDLENKNLYLTRVSVVPTDNPNPESSELVRVNYSDLENITFDPLGVLKNPMYGSSMFLDYDRDYNSFAIISQGGDACSGWGTISLFDLNSNRSSQIQEFAAGCAPGTRYLGYYDKRVVLSEPIECDVDFTMSGSCFKNVYSINPFNTNRKDVIYTFSAPYAFDQAYTDQKLGVNEVAISKPFRLVDDPKGTVNYYDDNFALDIKTGTLRDLPDDVENITSFMPEPTPQILKENNSIAIIRTGDQLVIQNKTDDDYLYEIVTDETDLSDWSPCSDGCDAVYAGKEVSVDLTDYYSEFEDATADLYWWEYESNPTGYEEIPSQNHVELW